MIRSVSKMEQNGTTVKYNLVIDYDPMWFKNYGVENLSEWIRTRLELALGSSIGNSRGTIKKFKRVAAKS